MSIRKLVIALTFMAIFAMAARVSVDTDTWWHLRAGQWIVENRSILQADPFSHTRLGSTWQYPGWLVEVPMYWIYNFAGPGGLNLWTAGMVTLAFIFVWRSLQGGVFLRAFTLVLAAAVSAVYWAARPYLVTFVFAAVFLAVLEDYRWNRANRLLALPLLMVVWANSHGGFAVGFILFGIYGLNGLTHIRFPRGASRKPDLRPAITYLQPMLVAGVLMLAAVCINPAGAVMLLYPFKTVGIGALQDYIQEWQSPDFHQLHVQPFAWLLLLTFGIVGASRRRLAFSDFLLFSTFGMMGLLAGRNVALFALVAPIVVARHAAPLAVSLGRLLGYQPLSSSPPTIPVGAPGKSRSMFLLQSLNWVMFFLLGLAVLVKVSLVFPASVNEEQFRKNLPVDAAGYIRLARPPGMLFNSYNWGGYLIWALPEYPVFIDGRTDLYSDELIGEWLLVMRVEPGWQALLRQYGVNLILVENGSTLDRQLQNEPGWVQSYSDNLAVVFQKK